MCRQRQRAKRSLRIERKKKACNAEEDGEMSIIVGN